MGFWETTLKVGILVFRYSIILDGSLVSDLRNMDLYLTTIESKNISSVLKIGLVLKVGNVVYAFFCSFGNYGIQQSSIRLKNKTYVGLLCILFWHSSMLMGDLYNEVVSIQFRFSLHVFFFWIDILCSGHISRCLMFLSFKSTTHGL